jgi:hypothetical protein
VRRTSGPTGREAGCVSGRTRRRGSVRFRRGRTAGRGYDLRPATAEEARRDTQDARGILEALHSAWVRRTREDDPGGWHRNGQEPAGGRKKPRRCALRAYNRTRGAGAVRPPAHRKRAVGPPGRRNGPLARAPQSGGERECFPQARPQRRRKCGEKLGDTSWQDALAPAVRLSGSFRSLRAPRAPVESGSSGLRSLRGRCFWHQRGTRTSDGRLFSPRRNDTCLIGVIPARASQGDDPS